MVMSLRKKLNAQYAAGNQQPQQSNIVSAIQPSQVPQPDGVASNGVAARRPLSSWGDSVDPGAANVGRDYEDWFMERQQQGLGFMPVPQPIASFREQRDPTTGDYLSRSFDFDFSGVPTPVANIMKLSVPELNRQTSGQLANINAIRGGVRSALPIDSQKYEQPRMVQKFDPYTGNSTFELVNSTQYRPFMGDPFISF